MMTKANTTTSLPVATPPRRGNRFMVIFMKQWQLYLMVLLPVVYILIFAYGPMGGIIVAFKDYSIRKGIMASPWAGLKYFEQFVSTPAFVNVLRNTAFLSLYSLAAGFVMPIFLALSLNEIKSVVLKKTVQMVTYFPFFISTVIMVGIVFQVLNPTGGIVNNIIEIFGGKKTNFMGITGLWRSIYVWSGVWQSTGYGAIIYIAALSGVDPQLVESAIIDGATRVQRVRHIDLPAIAPTVTIMLVLSIGNIMGIGFEKVFLMQNNLNLDVSEIISTYVYKRGLISFQYSFATAVGVFNSVINFMLLLLANMAARRLSENSLW